MKESVKIIAEIGINHNGDVNLANKMIALAAISGCDYVKFQKRNPDISVPKQQKNKLKKTPWGDMTYLEYKKKIEFEIDEFNEINAFCKEMDIGWFSSVWDVDSVDFIAQNYFDDEYGVIMKIPSAHLTNFDLLQEARKKSDFLLLSTGMSDENDIVKAIEISDPDVIFHTNSTYPTPINELNLGYISWLKEKYPNKIIGYSGHEYGLVTTFATVPLGVEWIERHITINHDLWGSDQKSSIEPSGLLKLVKGVRDIESSLSGYGERKCLGGELKKRKSLRGY